MKRAIFATFILSAMMSIGCQNDDNFVVTPDGTDNKITLFATSANSSTKVGYEDLTLSEQKISLSWENNSRRVDSFTIYDAAGDRVGDFKYSGTDGAKSGEFTQVGNFEMVGGEEYTAVIPAGSYPTIAEHDAASTTDEQSVSKISDINYLDGAMKLKGTLTFDEAGENNILFNHELSLARVVLTMPSGLSAAKIKMSDCDIDYTLTLPAGISEQSITTFIAVNTIKSSEARDIDFIITDTDGTEHAITKRGTTQKFEAGVYYTIKVEVQAPAPSVVDFYEDGVEINGVTYSKSSNNAQLLTESGVISSKDGGVIFLDPKDEDQVFTLNGATYTSLVIIGRYPTSKPKVNCAGIQYFGTGESIIYKNIDITGFSTNYTFAFASSGTGTLENWIVEDCKITTASDKPLSYFNNASGSISNISFLGNKIALTVSANNKNVNILSFSKVDPAVFKSINFTNNTIYSSSEFYANGAIFTIAPTTTSNLALSVKNNTIIDFIATTATFNIPNASTVEFDKNIFWGTSTIAVNTNLLRFTESDASASVNFGENIAYGLTDKNYWRQYTSSTTFPTEGNSSSFTKAAADPFATFDKSTGTFLQSAQSAGYGSTIK